MHNNPKNGYPNCLKTKDCCQTGKKPVKYSNSKHQHSQLKHTAHSLKLSGQSPVRQQARNEHCRLRQLLASSGNGPSTMLSQ